MQPAPAKYVDSVVLGKGGEGPHFLFKIIDLINSSIPTFLCCFCSLFYVPLCAGQYLIVDMARPHGFQFSIFLSLTCEIRIRVSREAIRGSGSLRSQEAPVRRP